VHDIRFIRDHPNLFDQGLARRGLAAMSKEIIDIDRQRRSWIYRSEEIKAASNQLSKQAGKAKSQGDEELFATIRQQVTEKKELEQKFSAQASECNSQLKNLLLTIPNLPQDDVPIGKDEQDNVEQKRWGQPKEFSFQPREHFAIPGVANLMDFATAGKLSGSRFVMLSGSIARLHRALAQFMIDRHVYDHNLLEVWTPILVNPLAMEGTGQLPKFAGDSYRTENGKWLIPTAEVTLTNIVNGLIINEDALPLRYCAHTQCFRSEAGSAGKDTTGMLRQHQFEKVEMVSITTPEASKNEQYRMLKCAETILEMLELPYRTMLLCSGDMGFGAQKTYDIEVWLPGQGVYREISSVSNCGNFQAQRMDARLRRNKSKDLEFVHTLNGSGLAVGRTLIAVLENGQCENGSVRLPPVLAKYLGNHSEILPNGQFN